MKSIHSQTDTIKNNQLCVASGLEGVQRSPSVKASRPCMAFGVVPTHAGALPALDSILAGPSQRKELCSVVLGDRPQRDFLSEPEQTLFNTSHLHRMAGAKRPLEAIGLSNGHNTPRAADHDQITPPRPQTAMMSVAMGGSLVRLKAKPSGLPPEKRPRVERGSVNGYSRKSATRLRRRISEADESQCGHASFVTLTYPGRYSADRREWMANLDAFDKRMRRECPGFIFMVWKLEPQKRGAPHFHLLLCMEHETTPESLRSLREFVAQSWYEIVDSHQPAHFLAGTQVETVKTWNGVKHYCSKYLAKTFDGDSVPSWWGPGRFWGVRGTIPTEIISIPLTQKQFYTLRRLVYRHLKAVTRGSGFRPKISSADSGVAIHWTDKTASQVLAWLNTMVYD